MNIKKFVDKVLLRYVIIGILNFIFCTGLMFLLFNFCGFSEHLAPVVNYALGSLIWYLACRYILFRGQETTWQSALRFVVEVVACYLVSYYLVAPLLGNWILEHERVRNFFSFGGESKISGNCEMTIGAIVYAILNYFGQRYFVFSARFEYHRKHHGDES